MIITALHLEDLGSSTMFFMEVQVIGANILSDIPGHLGPLVVVRYQL